MDLTFILLVSAFPAAAVILVLIVNWRRKGAATESGQAAEAESPGAGIRPDCGPR